MKTYFRPCAILQLPRVCVCCRVLMYEMSRVPESVIVLEHPRGPKEFWDLQLVKCGNATRVFSCLCLFMKSQPAVCACVRVPVPVPSLQTGLPYG